MHSDSHLKQKWIGQSYENRRFYVFEQMGQELSYNLYFEFFFVLEGF